MIVYVRFFYKGVINYIYVEIFLKEEILCMVMFFFCIWYVG